MAPRAARRWRMRIQSGRAIGSAPLAKNPRGTKCGSTKRVVAAAPMSPVMENSPNCAKPVKLENSMALNPAMEVSAPKRKVGQMRRSVSLACSPWPVG